jgi:hypothetical protein
MYRTPLTVRGNGSRIWVWRVDAPIARTQRAGIPYRIRAASSTARGVGSRRLEAQCEEAQGTVGLSGVWEEAQDAVVLDGVHVGADNDAL